MPLTVPEALAHKRRLRRLVIQMLLLVLGGWWALSARAGVLAIMLAGLFLIQQFRLQFYVLDDLRYRGYSPMWAFAPGFSLIIWLIWRRWHPIQTTRGPVS